jgi:DNA-binding CsgD family transcriptional regulator/tetratricopeptide (TPR) repeat protein
MRAETRVAILGREPERAALLQFLDAAATGSSALVLEGDAGVGKTTLWDAAIELARSRGFTVLRAQPVEAEATLAFTALGDLLDGVLEPLLDTIAAPQSDALRAALLLERPVERHIDQRAVSVAFLAVLRTLAREGPVVVAIDDVQWLDEASAAVLAFAARRLKTERIGLLLARRSGEPSVDLAPAGRRLAIGPLPPNDAHHLVRERLGLTLSGPTLRALWAAADGNPFYMLELARGLAGGNELPGVPITTIPESMTAVLRARVAALPEATRAALSIVAALSQPTLLRLERAGSSHEALRPAIEAGIVDRSGDVLRFRHPLLAAAAYAYLEDTARLALHRRLADTATDAEERGRHLALGSDSPSPEIATALELGAVQAKSRGATTTAAQLFESAVRFTPADATEDRHRRLLAAARERFVGGETPRAISLFEAAVASAASGTARAEARAGLAEALVFEGDQSRAAALLQQVLEEPDLSPALRASAADHLAGALFYLRERLDEAASWCSVAVSIGLALGDRSFLVRARSTTALVDALRGRPIKSSMFKEDPAFEGRVVEGSAYNHGVYLLWIDRLPEAIEIMQRCRAEAVARGDESSLSLILAQLAQVEFLAGRWAAAEVTATEAHDAAVQAGQRTQQAFASSARALVQAASGREDEARASVSETLELSGTRSMGVSRIHAHWAMAILDLSMGRTAEVIARLTPLRQQLVAGGVRELGTIRFVADEIEALIVEGQLDAARDVLDWFAGLADELGRISAQALAARAHGLLKGACGEAEAGLEDLRAALVHHGGDGIPFERARTLLSYGALLRRVRRRAEARVALEAAAAEFRALGGAIWADRANAEIRRIGGRQPAGSLLTAAELRTASLVADGLTNKEIAARMFVTAKTIETRLGRMYEKLGVHSRTELTRRLSAGESAPKP